MATFKVATVLSMCLLIEQLGIATLNNYQQENECTKASLFTIFLKSVIN